MTVYIHPPVPYGNIILQWTLLHNISNTYDVVNYTYRFRLVAEGRLLWRGTSILSSNQLRASGPFLRCWHSQSLGRTSHYHVHTASPSATCTRSTSFQSHVLKIHFNIILPSIAVRPEWSLPFSSCDQNFACIFHFFHASYTPRQSHISCCDHYNRSFLGRVRTINLHYLYVTFSISSYYLPIACISSAPCLQTF